MFIQKVSSRSLRFVLMTFASLVLSIGAVWAQEVKVSGTVTDAAGSPLVGVYVLVQGTTTGTSTGINGDYTLDAPANGTLVYSLMGMKDVVAQVNNRSVINVTMEEDAVLLGDAVVTAMGIKRERKALGYAVQDLQSDEIIKNKTSNLVSSMAGKIAGVNITQSGGSAGAGSNIIIRGGTSLERDNQPLFVVDGIIYDNSSNLGGDSGFDGAMRTSTTTGNRVMDINPEDIENMSVLKGPAASALYGSKAAAGVIIITTKKGSEGRVQVDFSSKYTRNWVNRLPEQQDVYKRGYYMTDGTLSDYTTQSWGAKYGASDIIYDNMEDFFQGSNVFDNTISISGGNKDGNFYLSASRYDQTGIIPGTSYDKTTFRFNGEQKFGRLTVSANVAYTISNTDKTLTSGGLYNSGGTGALVSVYRWAKSDDMKHWLNADGTKYRMFEGLQELADDVENPYWIINKDVMTDKTNRFTGGINASYKVAEWFDINYRVGYDTYDYSDYTFLAPGSAVKETLQNGQLSENDRKYTYISSNLMLNFHKTFGDWNFNLLLGQSIEDQKSERQRRMGFDFIIDDFYSFDNIATANKQFQSSESRSRLMGLYGEFRVEYKNIAYLTVTGRNDWTSTLPVDNRSYFYPSVSGSFVFTELLPKNDILSFGKIRASWARVGKDTDPYVTTTTLWPSLLFLGGLGVGNNWQRGNPYLKPERTESWEVGLDMRFFEGRLGFDFTYYSNNSKDQIVVPRLSQTTGYILLSTNVGRVTNKGIELAINATPVTTKNFTWETTLNLAHNKGRVHDLMTGQDILYVTDVQVGNAKAASFNTKPAVYDDNGNLVSEAVDGLFMGISGSKWMRDPNGNIVVDSNTGLPRSDGATTHLIGNREPKVSGGWNNSLQYKNWNLSFLFDYRIGGDIYNGTEYMMTNAGLSTRTLNRESITINGVVNTGTDAAPVYEPVSTTYTAGNMYNINGTLTSGEKMIQDYWSTYLNESANFITETNWLRLRSISISYDFKDLIKGQDILKGLTATLSGTNLWLWTNYEGLDPENSAAGAGVVGSGSAFIDYCGVPSTAGFSFGINLTF